MTATQSVKEAVVQGVVSYGLIAPSRGSTYMIFHGYQRCKLCFVVTMLALCIALTFNPNARLVMTAMLSIRPMFALNPPLQPFISHGPRRPALAATPRSSSLIRHAAPIDTLTRVADRHPEMDRTPAAAAIMAALRERYPDRPLGYFSPSFVASVAELIERHGNPIEYYINKLSEIVEWRKEETVDDILLQDFPRLEPGVMFWHGVDHKRQPVLFVRPGLVDMSEFDEAKTYRTVIAVIEEGIAQMGDGPVRFSVVIDTTGVGVRYFLPRFIRKLFYLLVLPYRYRLGAVLVGPTNPLVNAIWQIAAPIVPETFKKNVILTEAPRQQLRQLMDEANIPQNVFR